MHLHQPGSVELITQGRVEASARMNPRRKSASLLELLFDGFLKVEPQPTPILRSGTFESDPKKSRGPGRCAHGRKTVCVDENHRGVVKLRPQKPVAWSEGVQRGRNRRGRSRVPRLGEEEFAAFRRGVEREAWCLGRTFIGPNRGHAPPMTGLSQIGPIFRKCL